MNSKKSESGITSIKSHPRTRNLPEDPVGPTFRRTKKGSEELVSRKQGLSEGQRKILLYANGSRTVEDFERLVPEVAESADILFVMEELGLLELYDPSLPDDVSARPAQAAAPSQAPQTSMQAPASNALDVIKAKLTRDTAAILGSESGNALKRIESIKSEEELREVMAKLVELIKLYAGGRESELFIREYDEYLGG